MSNPSKPSPRPSATGNPTLKELVGIRTELRKLNQKVLELETQRHSQKTRKLKISDWSGILRQYGQFIAVALLLFAIALIVLWGFSGLHRAIARTPALQYEYDVISPGDLDFTATMNQYGSEGWQVINCRRAMDSITEDYSYECIIFRPLTSDQ